MSDRTFFSPIEQFEVELEGFRFCIPVFYYAALGFTVSFLTPLERVKALLPSPRFKPVRVSPWHTLTLISAFQYLDTDIGPYNEGIIFFPITLDKPAPLLTGVKHWFANPFMYVWHMPVTTEIARWGGVRLFNLPKFIANIEFKQQDDRMHSRVVEGDREIFTLSVPAIANKPGNPMRVNLLSRRADRILRSEIIQHWRNEGGSYLSAGIHFELGSHPIADELRQLQLGRPINYQYLPEFQSILTLPLESLPAHVA